MESSTSSSKPIYALNSDSKILHLSARVLTVLITLGAFVLSFNSLSELAVEAGIPQELSWVWALCIDGFIIINTLAAFSLQNKGKSSIYAWSILLVFVGFSIFGNAWHAVLATTEYKLPLAVSVLVTAIPPVTLFLSIHLLILMVQPTKEQKLDSERVKKRQSRLQAIEDREIEKLEKEAVIARVNETKAAQIVHQQTAANKKTVHPTRSNTSRVKPALKQSPKAPVRSSEALIVDSANSGWDNDGKPLDERTPETVEISNKDTGVLETTPERTMDGAGLTSDVTENLTQEEAINRLVDMMTLGEELPSGRLIANWLGKSERTGQNLLKKFKTDYDLV